MQKQVVKTISSEYIVYINNHPVKIFNSGKNAWSNFAEAKKYVANLEIDDKVESVKIVQQVLLEKVLRSFKPKIKRVLTIDELFDNGDLDEHDATARN